MKFGIAQQTKIGNRVSGDTCVVLEGDRHAVVAIIDGLGSGEKAARSAQLAATGVKEHPDAALTDILTYCHYIILAAGGVGAVMALLRLDTAQQILEFAGVGNIRFLAHSHNTIQPITRYGYLGVRLPTLRDFRFPYTPGDLFILHTDGVSSRFHLHNHAGDIERGPQFMADLICEQYGKEHDDLTVVVVQTEE